jgi:hypothetical protein
MLSPPIATATDEPTPTLEPAPTLEPTQEFQGGPTSEKPKVICCLYFVVIEVNVYKCVVYGTES